MAAPAILCRELEGYPPPEILFGGMSERPGAFLIDRGAAVLPGERERWSFLGSDPSLVITSRGGHLIAEGRLGGGPREDGPRHHSRGEVLTGLRDLLDGLGFADGSGLAEGGGRRSAPAPFTAGAIGYFGYDLKHAIERLPEPASPPDTDDLHLGIHEAVAGWNHDTGKLWLIARGLGAGGELAAGRALDALHRRIDEAAQAVGSSGIRPETPRGRAAGPGAGHRLNSGEVTLRWNRSFTPQGYQDAVRRIRTYIAEGEIYQANLSQRFEAEIEGSGWSDYLALRAASPAPCAMFLRCGDMEIISASPERFLSRKGDRVETRPIKGTRRRGVTPAEDARLAAELLESPKDRAELVMIVDLERNDLGRICRTGTVEVSRLAGLESYAQVHHLVATVTGRLRPGTGLPEILRATFPGGSITGAPKIRAMEILDVIEPTRRGPYTGAAGWIDVSGDMDLQIAIRTAYRSGSRVWYQVGAGIVWDSDPRAEYEETLAKGAALAAVLTRKRGAPAGGEGA